MAQWYCILLCARKALGSNPGILTRAIVSQLPLPRRLRLLFLLRACATAKHGQATRMQGRSAGWARESLMRGMEESPAKRMCDADAFFSAGPEDKHLSRELPTAHRSSQLPEESLPEWFKGVDSSATSPSCVGSNPTAVISSSGSSCNAAAQTAAGKFVHTQRLLGSVVRAHVASIPAVLFLAARLRKSSGPLVRKQQFQEPGKSGGPSALQSGRYPS